MCEEEISKSCPVHRLWDEKTNKSLVLFIVCGTKKQTISSVQYMVSMLSEKPICAPSRLQTNKQQQKQGNLKKFFARRHHPPSWFRKHFRRIFPAERHYNTLDIFEFCFAVIFAFVFTLIFMLFNF